MSKTDLYQSLLRRSFIAGLFLIGVTIVAMPAYAQDMNARLKRIENEIQTLSRAVFRGEEPPPGSVAMGDNVSATATANTELRLQQIEMELRELTGTIEQQNFQARQYEDRTEKTLADLERRIAGLEAQLANSGTGTMPLSTGPQYPGRQSVPQNGQSAGWPDDNRAASNEDMTDGAFENIQSEGEQPQDEYLTSPAGQGQLGTLRQPLEQPVPEGAQIVGIQPSMGTEGPVETYERGFSLLRERDYNNAEQVFTAFLSRYPDHELASNAKYWLGETFYVRNNYEKAARIFAEAYQQYPEGSKGPDNLLKLGMALAGMEKTDDACVTFAQLKKEYPSSAAPILMRAEREMTELGCQQF